MIQAVPYKCLSSLNIIFSVYNTLSCLCHPECDKLRKDGFRSSQYYSQGPIFSDPLQSTNSLREDEDDENDKKVHVSTLITVRHTEISPGRLIVHVHNLTAGPTTALLLFSNCVSAPPTGLKWKSKMNVQDMGN